MVRNVHFFLSIVLSSPNTKSATLTTFPIWKNALIYLVRIQTHLCALLDTFFMFFFLSLTSNILYLQQFTRKNFCWLHSNWFSELVWYETRVFSCFCVTYRFNDILRILFWISTQFLLLKHLFYRPLIYFYFLHNSYKIWPYRDFDKCHFGLWMDTSFIVYRTVS